MTMLAATEPPYAKGYQSDADGLGDVSVYICVKQGSTLEREY